MTKLKISFQNYDYVHIGDKKELYRVFEQKYDVASTEKFFVSKFLFQSSLLEENTSEYRNSFRSSKVTYCVLWDYE